MALRAGGYLDTIVEGVNGVFVDAPTVDDVVAGVARLVARDWDGEAMQDHAASFSEDGFGRQIQKGVSGLNERVDAC